VTTSSVGEVWVTVKLTNWGDEMLAQQGQLSPDQVRTVETRALVDTGSAWSVLSPDVAGRLGLGIRTRRAATYADGRSERVAVAMPVLFELLGRDIVEDALVLGNLVLIGQTVLQKLDLLVDCRGERLIPNPAHPDGPVARV
jgi:predicted aspartyl protease